MSIILTKLSLYLFDNIKILYKYMNNLNNYPHYAKICALKNEY